MTDNRKVWDVQLDLLEKFKSICDKYNLTWSASSGTLLGAVRHKGFIPWDDDMDVALPWEDYKVLLEVAPKECQYPYYFQSFLSHPEGEMGACRLRRSDTTGFTLWEYQNVSKDYDRGIFIDIFPYFYVPDSDEERAIQKEAVLFFWQCIRGCQAVKQKERGREPNPRYLEYIPYYETVRKSMSLMDLKWAYVNACAMCDHRTKTIGATSSRVHKPNLMWDSEWYDSYVDLPFENTTIRCPARYEEVLERHYGDWRTPVQGGAVHEMVILDTETPWKEFDEKQLEMGHSPD